MSTIQRWFSGELSATTTVWLTLAPIIVLLAYFILGLLAYTVRCAWRGPIHDTEVASRGSSWLLGAWLRQYFVWVTGPLWRTLLRLGIPATAVTTLSTLLSLAAGVALASGRFGLGGWLYVFSGICDFLDGRLARARHRASPTGAALDSVLDRYNEAAVLVGLCWYFRDSWVLAAGLLALVGSLLVPYIRARGEGLGVSVRVGLMQRPERILILGAGLTLSPVLEAMLAPGDPRPLHRLAVLAIVLIALTTQGTALRRLVVLLGSLGDRRPWPPREEELRHLPPRRMVLAALATAADALLVVLLVGEAGLRPWLATAVGCALGAALRFALDRLAGGREELWPAPVHLRRYGLLAFTSALLNAGGVAVLGLLPGLDYRIGWVLVRAAVFVAWNSPLHHEYVLDRGWGAGTPRPESAGGGGGGGGEGDSRRSVDDGPPRAAPATAPAPAIAAEAKGTEEPR